MPEVLIIGPGALGSYVAAHMTRGEYGVMLGARTKKAADHLRAHGVTATDQDGATVHGEVEASHKPSDLPVDPQIVVLATRCQHAALAWKQWRTHVPASAPVVAVQNGLMGPQLQELMGDRLVLATTTFNVLHRGIGVSERTGPGGFEIGAWPPRPRPNEKERQVKRLLALAGEAAITENIHAMQWTKLALNSILAGVGVTTGVNLGEAVKDRDARELMLDIATEGVRVAEAHGIRLGHIHGFRPRMFADSHPGASRRMRHFAVRSASFRFRKVRVSTLQALERGQQTEIDYLNGAIVAAGAERGIPTPVNERVVELIHRIEAGAAKPSMDHIQDLLA